MDLDTTTSFGDWRDRLTYVLAEAQWLVGGTIVAVGVGLAMWSPDLPAAPEWLVHFIAAVLILGPPLFFAGLKFARWLRVRNYVVVFEVDAVEDTLQKYLVPPAVWQAKTVEGADPWPVNGGSAWAVRQFDWHEGIEELVVEGVWLSELSDDKLLTKKRHMEAVHGTLLKKYLELSAVRDRVSRMGIEIQEDTVVEMSEAAERARVMDPEAIKDAYESAQDDAEGLGTDDLPTIEDGTAETANPSDSDSRDDQMTSAGGRHTLYE